LNAILGYAQILEDEEDLAEKHREEVTEIVSAAEHLLEVINQVLDCAKLESGGIVLEPKPVSPNELLRRCASLVQHMCRSKGISLVTDISESCSRKLLIDPLRFRQMVLNLLGNAVKFTSKGWVRLEANIAEVAREEAHLEVIVSDTGPGIDQENLPMLFDRFTQVPGKAVSVGTGLGLAIVKGIATIMRGSVDVRSQLGEGSSFRVRVVAPVAPEATSPSAQRVSPPRRLRSTTQKKKRILVVDDNLLNRKVFATMLERAGHQVQLSCDGEEAVDLFSHQESPFDVILMDRHMPGIDGVEAAERIRGTGEAGRRVAIHLLTADLVSESELPGLKERGIDSVLSKPLGAADLLAALERTERTCA
jgi:CheY-like chemotaxis protein/anti-sigma regulatory factor (Ser/Thr protein kinase)